MKTLVWSVRRGRCFYSYVSCFFSSPFFLYIKSIIIIIFKARSSIDLPYQVFWVMQYLFDTCLLPFVVSPQSTSSLITILYSYSINIYCSQSLMDMKWLVGCLGFYTFTHLFSTKTFNPKMVALLLYILASTLGCVFDLSLLLLFGLPVSQTSAVRTLIRRG